MGSAFSYQKAQSQENCSNHSPLLVRGRSYCECDDYHCEEPKPQTQGKSEAITDNSGSDIDIMFCLDLASCAAQMELVRQEDGSQWPENECLQDYKGVDHGEPLDPSLNLRRLNDLYEDYLQQWESSEACGISRTVFQDVLNKKTPTPINICMCLGLGSFSGKIVNGENQWDVPMSQLVAFDNWVTMIETHQQTKPRVFFQDPSFNALDRQFLTERGCVVIDTPNSNEVITRETFLFTPGACYNVVHASLRQVFPALYLGIDFDRAWCCRLTGYAVWKMLTDFLATRNKAYMAISSAHVDYKKKWGGSGSKGGYRKQNWEIVFPMYYTPKKINGPASVSNGESQER